MSHKLLIYHPEAKLYEKTLTLGGFSKSWAMTGWRLGYAAGPRDVIQHMITLQQYTFGNACSFVQKAAIKALDFNVDDCVCRGLCSII
jgi:aspartate/methionine/tyrosine aminotransferase